MTTTTTTKADKSAEQLQLVHSLAMFSSAKNKAKAESFKAEILLGLWVVALCVGLIANLPIQFLVLIGAKVSLDLMFSLFLAGRHAYLSHVGRKIEKKLRNEIDEDLRPSVDADAPAEEAVANLNSFLERYKQSDDGDLNPPNGRGPNLN